MTLMAGAEAEVAIFGTCEGGDGDDRVWIARMLDSEAAKPGADVDRLEERLRRATRMLVRRHVGKVYSLALALWRHDTIGDEVSIRAATGLDPEPPAFDYWASIGMTDTAVIGSIVRAH